MRVSLFCLWSMKSSLVSKKKKTNQGRKDEMQFESGIECECRREEEGAACEVASRRRACSGGSVNSACGGVASSLQTLHRMRYILAAVVLAHLMTTVEGSLTSPFMASSMRSSNIKIQLRGGSVEDTLNHAPSSSDLVSAGYTDVREGATTSRTPTLLAMAIMDTGKQTPRKSISRRPPKLSRFVEMNE
mmetsp:Transcript_20228/g.56033  ORF Transcript_20228/g.56033 Transcript_20228/m.56033 type:complete len:189 (-) Transcript_20228:46-612(-)